MNRGSPRNPQPILDAHPHTQAIYLYGTRGTEQQRGDGDLIEFAGILVASQE